MAEATKFENIIALADTNTLSGSCRFTLLLTAGSDAAALTLTIGSSSIVLKAAAGTSAEISQPIHLKAGATASVGLTGTSPTAYAILEVK